MQEGIDIDDPIAGLQVHGDRSRQWDDAKAAQVEALRGISFQLAAGVFLDPHRLDMIDERLDYGEERRVTIGSSSSIVLAVVYTMRGDTCRIVTAWPASRKQRKAYHGDV